MTTAASKIHIDTGRISPYIGGNQQDYSMSRSGRPRNPELRADVKLSMPASLVAEVDLLLVDPLTKKPKYGARSKLTAALWQNWLAHMKGDNPQSPAPTIEQLVTESS